MHGFAQKGGNTMRCVVGQGTSGPTLILSGEMHHLQPDVLTEGSSALSALAGTECHVVMDGVDQLDMTGVTFVLNMITVARTKGIHLTFTGCRKQPYTRLTLSGFDRLCTITQQRLPA